MISNAPKHGLDLVTQAGLIYDAWTTRPSWRDLDAYIPYAEIIGKAVGTLISGIIDFK